ncbi:MAG: hypothetical protein ACREQ7_09810, partial [Candidatus Binatia bacterium]
QYFNRKHRKVGHLFQGRYKAIVCEKDEYLLTLVRYIHLGKKGTGYFSIKRPNAAVVEAHCAENTLSRTPGRTRLCLCVCTIFVPADSVIRP